VVGGRALTLPGIRIGSRTVIGAGSVVTRDVPDEVFAAGTRAESSGTSPSSARFGSRRGATLWVRQILEECPQAWA